MEDPHALAAKLLDHAEGIADLDDQREMQADIRAAAVLLNRLDAEPMPLLERLTHELKTAAEFADAGTRKRLEALIGEV